jgi:hypothetical protein
MYFLEHDSEHLGFIQRGKFIDCPGDHQLLDNVGIKDWVNGFLSLFTSSGVINHRTRSSNCG